MKEKTCNTCLERDNCKALCSDMLNKLKNNKNRNNIYSDNSFFSYNNVQADELSSVLYGYGLSEIENRDMRRVVIALLNKEQRDILSLYSQGYSQKEIADIQNVSQADISKRIKTIKNKIKKSLIIIIPYIIN